MRYSDASPASRDRSIENPRLRSPVSAARVVCGSQPVASTSASSVAPACALSISVTSACFDPARGEVTFSGGGVVAELFEPLPLLKDKAGRSCVVRDVAVNGGQPYAFSISETDLKDCKR